MDEVLSQLVSQLSLERIKENLFCGQSQDLGWGQVYGGQVLGQSLSAAYQTVAEERVAHSLHAYFLRPGDAKESILYEVDRIRDGTSFTTRRVVATQGGRPIFHMSASFQLVEKGFEHQDVMPIYPEPEKLRSAIAEWRVGQRRIPERVRSLALSEKPIEVIPVDPVDLFEPEPRAQHHAVWMKAVSRLPDSPQLHHALLAYASDFSFMPTALRPHSAGLASPKMQVASIDHVIWFHGPCRMDEWVLHAVHSPWAGGARGLVRGSIFSRSGKLLASTAQEGLMRRRSSRS